MESDKYGIYELHMGLVQTFEDEADAIQELEDMLDTKGQHLRENYYVDRIDTEASMQDDD